MTRQNHRVYAYVGLNPRAMIRKFVVLDTGAGSSFIQKDMLPSEVRAKLHPPRGLANIRDANNRKVEVGGVVNLSVRIANRLERVSFQVV